MGFLQILLRKICDPRDSHETTVTDGREAPPSPNVTRPSKPTRSTTWYKTPAMQAFRRNHPVGEKEIADNLAHNMHLPINQLPHELLIEIFIVVCHTDAATYLWDQHRYRSRNTTTPLTLGSICSHWRAVVWAAPIIWSHIFLSLLEKRYMHQLALLSDWISRAGDCLLTLALAFPNEHEWTNLIPYQFISIFYAHRHRWRSITWVFPEAWYPSLAGIEKDFVNLTSICTQSLSSDCALAPSDRQPLTLFESAPLLTDVHINGYYISDVSFQWAKLTRLTIKQIYLDECFYVLALTPNLSFCLVSNVLSNDVGRPSGIPKAKMVLKSLTSLAFSRASWENMKSLLCNVSFPAMRSLKITLPEDALKFSELATVLREPTGASTLRCLVLSDIKFFNRFDAETMYELKDLLTSSSLLEELEVHMDNLKSPNVLDGLWLVDLLKDQSAEARTQGSESPCPCLPRPPAPVIRAPVSSNEESTPPISIPVSPPSTSPPSSSCLSPSYFLPNLQHFKLSVPRTSAQSQRSGDDRPDDLFASGLLEILQQRRQVSNSNLSSPPHNVTVSDDLSEPHYLLPGPLQKRLLSFRLESGAYVSEEYYELPREVRAGLWQLFQHGMDLKVALAGYDKRCRWA